jgi:hypothetical protein
MNFSEIQVIISWSCQRNVLTCVTTKIICLRAHVCPFDMKVGLRNVGPIIADKTVHRDTAVVVESTRGFWHVGRCGNM